MNWILDKRAEMKLWKGATSYWSLCTYVCMLLHVHVCVASVCVLMCKSRPEDNPAAISQGLLTFFWHVSFTILDLIK